MHRYITLVVLLLASMTSNAAGFFSPELGRFITRDPARYIDGGNLYTGYFAMRGGFDPSGLDDIDDAAPTSPDCFNVTASRTWQKDGAQGIVDYSVGITFFVKGTKCDKCCDDGSKGYTIKGYASLSAGFELGAAPWRVATTGGWKYFDYKVDGWVGLRFYGGIKGTLEGSVDYDTCKNKFSIDGDGYIAGYVGVEGGGSLELRARIRIKLFGLRYRKVVNVNAKAVVVGRLTLKWWPALRCNRSTCRVSGPTDLTLAGYADISSKVLKWRFSRRWDFGQVSLGSAPIAFSFSNPLP